MRPIHMIDFPNLTQEVEFGRTRPQSEILYSLSSTLTLRVSWGGVAVRMANDGVGIRYRRLRSPPTPRWALPIPTRFRISR